MAKKHTSSKTMCEIKDLTVMVADSDEVSLDAMCKALVRIGMQQLVCAEDAAHGLNLSLEVLNDNKVISMLFCNANLRGMPLGGFMENISHRHNNVISISYSKCIAPEAHLMSMFNTGVVDHIEQNVNFDERVQAVTGRWLRAAQLQFDYGQRYGYRRRQPTAS